MHTVASDVQCQSAMRCAGSSCRCCRFPCYTVQGSLCHGTAGCCVGRACLRCVLHAQEQLLRGLLSVWLTAAASAGVKLPRAGLAQQEGAAAQLAPLLPPFFADLTLGAQGSPLKDGRWGLQGAHLAWQVCSKAGHGLNWAL